MRYVVLESSGHLDPAPGDVRRPPNFTFSVHDSLYLYRTVKLFRTEDLYGGRTSRAEAYDEARNSAELLAARLNDAA